MAENRVSIAQLARALGHRGPSTLRRRLLGESEMPAVEFLRISEAFGLPTQLTALDDSKTNLHFRLSGTPGNEFRAEAYLAGILQLARVMGRGGTYYVSSSDLPFSPLCSYPLLAFLQLFMLEGGGGREDVAFDYEALRTTRKEVLRDLQAVAVLYGKEANVEVWGQRPLASFLERLRALRERQAIDDEIVEAAREDLLSLISDLRDAARVGAKTAGGRFELYVHGMQRRATNIVADAPSMKLAIHTIQHPYYAVSDELSTVALFRKLFDDLVVEAVPVNGRAPYRYREYFDRMATDVMDALSVLVE